MRSPFKLAAAGWTLSPLELDSWAKHGGTSPADGGNSSTIPLNGDRTRWNTALGAEYEAMSAIAGHVGAFPIDPGFEAVGRSA